MNKAAAPGGNLESILASIRQSLAEESTDALTEDAAAPPPPAPKSEAERKDAAPAPRREGLTKRLAETSPLPVAEGSDDLADLIEPLPGSLARTEPAAVQAAASAPEPAAPAPVLAGPEPEPAAAPPPGADGDPLWFLTPGPEPEAAKATEAAAATSEPTLRPDVVRASLPPFFGSSVEAEKPEVVTAPPAPIVAPRRSTARPEPVSSAGGSDLAKERVTPVPAPAAAPSAPAASPPLRNGRANSLFEPPAEAKPAASVELSGSNPLEGVVVDMLRPMLRQWLDENMPRLVASALAEEAARKVREPKKP